MLSGKLGGEQVIDDWLHILHGFKGAEDAVDVFVFHLVHVLHKVVADQQLDGVQMFGPLYKRLK